MSGLQKVLRKLMVTQYEEVILNKDGLTVIIMKPNERVMLELGKSIEDSLKLLRNLKEKDNLNEFMNVVEKLLVECIRHPDDYRYKIIVPDNFGEEPFEYQTDFSSFNPKIDNEVLLAQKLITPYEFENDTLGSSAGKIVLFLLILRMMGIISPQTESPKQIEEVPEGEDKKKLEDDPEKQKIVENYNEIESFPGDDENTKETNSG